MPLTPHGKRMKSRMEDEYGKETGDSVLYASKNAGKPGFTNIDKGRKSKRHKNRTSHRK